MPEDFAVTVAIRQLFSGQPEEAFASAQSHLRQVVPPDARAVLVLATIAFDHGNLVRAEELVGIAEGLGGAERWACVIRGRLALGGSDTATARECARAALSAPPEHPAITGELGVLLARTGLHAASVPCFRETAEAAPFDAQALYNLAVALQFSGDLDGARDTFSWLLAAHPGHAQGRLAAIGLDRHTDDHAVADLENRFAAATEGSDRLAFGHAIAKVLEDLGRWKESLAWLEKAKASRPPAMAHDRAATEALFAAATAAADGVGIPMAGGDPTPVLVVGLPRTGTTLVERVLSAHSGVSSAGELSDFAVLLKRLVATPGPLVLDPATIAAGAKRNLSPIAEPYLTRLRAIAETAANPPVERIIDKMPFNLFLVPHILAALPGARVICLRRDPRDAVLSNFRQLFATGFTYYSYAYDLEDAAHFVASFERLADHYAARLPPERFTILRYEALVGDFASEAKRLIAFAGLDWEDACLRFHANTAPVATASAVQVRQPLYATSIGRWRRYGAGADRIVAALSRFGIDCAESPDTGSEPGI